MKLSIKLGLLASAMAAAASANATIIATPNAAAGSLLTLSSAGLSDSNGLIATLSGGAVLTSGQNSAAAPSGNGALYGGNYLAAGPTVGQPAVLSFVNAVSQLGFLWGSPDTYNSLVLTSITGMKYSFTAADLGFPGNGNKSMSYYAQFNALGTDRIASASFNNVPSQDAFEAANFSVAGVPEPGTWMLMLGGFGLVGYAMRRRSTVSFGQA